MLTEYNTTIIVCKCDMCCQLLYEGDKVLILKETKDTIICPMFCDDICLYNSMKKYPFLENYQSIKIKVLNNNNDYYKNMFNFLKRDLYYSKIIIYDCSFDPIKILQYIYNILKKRTKTNWEKTLIQNCLRHNLIKIEKIF
jgi:hypothetical protein